jgi:hypothetical protein
VFAVDTIAKSKPSQLDKFKQTARELGCDEDEGRWNERFRKVAKPQGRKRDSDSASETP